MNAGTQFTQPHWPVANRITSLNQNATIFRTYATDSGGNISTDTRPGETYVPRPLAKARCVRRSKRSAGPFSQLRRRASPYNKRNRLSSLTRNAVAYATYGYNALAEMTTRFTSATGGPTGQVAYIYDLDGHLMAEATASTGATTRDYIWQAANDNAPVDMPLAVAEAALLYMVHTDHLGRPIRMTDSTKATVFQAVYKPYGEVYSTSGAKAQNLRFPGQYFQIETGFAYNWRRHYDPITGRYTQPDPLGLNAGMNRFGYVRNSPFMRIDRNGLWTIQVGISFGVNYGPGAGTGGFGIAIDGRGNIASYTVTGLGVGAGGAGSAGVSIDGSNGKTVRDLSGPFANYNGNIGAGPSVGGNYFTGFGEDGTPVTGGGGTVGAGIGTAATSFVTYTSVTPLFNIFSFFTYLWGGC